MKTIMLLLVVVNICFGEIANGQTFRAIPVQYRIQNISNSLKSYNVYRMEVKSIREYVLHAGSNPTITLEIDGVPMTWTLIENPLLRPETKVTTTRNGKIVPLEYDHRCITYIGFQNGKEEVARFTIAEHTFVAMIPGEKADLYLQPLSYYDHGADSDLLVAYYSRDVVLPDANYCATPEKIRTDLPKENTERNAGNASARSFSCRELEVSLATDRRMYEDFDHDVDSIISFNLTVLNMVEHFYNDFDLDFWVREMYISTSFGADDPWGNDLDVNDLRPDFGDWAYTEFVTEDIGHLWTTGDLHDGSDYNTLGQASVGGACDDIGVYPWAVLEVFTNDIYNLALLQAHEFGHLLDADHEEGGGTIMEPSLNDITCACWAQDNIEEMLDFMEDESCIESCVQCPVTYYIIDYIAYGDWKYSTIDHITSKAVINGSADVVMQSIGYVKLTPGFVASTKHANSSGSSFVAKIADCE